MLNQKHLKNTGDFLVILIGFPDRFTFLSWIKKFFVKTLDKRKILWYNDYRKQERRKENEIF